MSGPGWLRRLAIERPEARAWALYDWANSAFMVTIITAVFPVYFLEFAAAELGPERGLERYSWTTTAALLTIALLAPILGAVGDVRGVKRRLLFAFAGLGIASTAGMFFVGQGDWELGLVLFALSNVGAVGSVVFYDSLLPHVAALDEVDQLSTTGFGLGYLGGGLLLGLNVAWISAPAVFGLPSGDALDASQKTLPYRLAFLSVAVWWAVFSLPLWRHVREPVCKLESDETPSQSALRVAFQRLGETFRELRRFRHAFLMLLAFLLYNDGILTIIRMATAYGKAKALDPAVLVATILMVQFVAFPFALLFGRLARRFGAKRMVIAGLAVYVGITVFAYFVETVTEFVVLGILVASVQGGCQALGRSLFARLVPKYKSGEFFALFAAGEKFAGLLGPLSFTLAISATGSIQAAILVIIPFFVVGALLLTRVDVEAGSLAARRADEAVHST